jgi:hypothetical protein
MSVLDPAANRPPAPGLDAPPTGSPAPGPSRRPGLRSAAGTRGSTRWTILVYLASRALLLAVALLTSAFTDRSLRSTLGAWDGAWYARLASQGYPDHIVHAASTLGFFPLLPLTMRLVAVVPGPLHSFVLAGVLVSCVGGLIATLLVARLATGWWGDASGARAAVLFCFFPGSVVFSMAYGEGLLIPLAAGCILALQQRRWVLAGVLAGIATAVQPDALVLFPVCAVSAALELRRDGPRSREALLSLLAPALSLAGIAVFAAYLWARTGTPFATLKAQRYGWHEKLNPLAIVHQGQDIWHQLTQLHGPHFAPNFAPVAALIGVIILLAGLRLLLRRPLSVSVEALVWTAGITLLALISENVAPSPRILITAFPAVIVFADRLEGRRYRWLIVLSTALLVLTSALTYGGHTLTP